MRCRHGSSVFLHARHSCSRWRGDAEGGTPDDEDAVLEVRQVAEGDGVGALPELVVLHRQARDVALRPHRQHCRHVLRSTRRCRCLIPHSKCQGTGQCPRGHEEKHTLNEAQEHQMGAA